MHLCLCVLCVPTIKGTRFGKTECFQSLGKIVGYNNMHITGSKQFSETQGNTFEMKKAHTQTLGKIPMCGINLINYYASAGSS